MAAYFRFIFSLLFSGNRGHNPGVRHNTDPVFQAQDHQLDHLRIVSGAVCLFRIYDYNLFRLCRILNAGINKKPDSLQDKFVKPQEQTKKDCLISENTFETILVDQLSVKQLSYFILELVECFLCDHFYIRICFRESKLFNIFLTMLGIDRCS